MWSQNRTTASATVTAIAAMTVHWKYELNTVKLYVLLGFENNIQYKEVFGY